MSNQPEQRRSALAIITITKTGPTCFVVRNREGKWMIPGGNIDSRGYNSVSGAIKRLKEQTNLSIKGEVKFITTKERYDLYAVIESTINDTLFDKRAKTTEIQEKGYVELLKKPGEFSVHTKPNEAFETGVDSLMSELSQLFELPPILTTKLDDSDECDRFITVLAQTSYKLKFMLNTNTFIMCVPQNTDHDDDADELLWHEKGTLSDLYDLYAIQHIFFSGVFKGKNNVKFEKLTTPTTTRLFRRNIITNELGEFPSQKDEDEYIKETDITQNRYVDANYVQVKDIYYERGPNCIEYTVKANKAPNWLSDVKHFIESCRFGKIDSDPLEIIERKEWGSNKIAAHKTLLSYFCLYYYADKDVQDDLKGDCEETLKELQDLFKTANVKSDLLNNYNTFYNFHEEFIPMKTAFDICAKVLSVNTFIALQKINKNWKLNALKQYLQLYKPDKAVRRIVFPLRPKDAETAKFSVKITESRRVAGAYIAHQDCVKAVKDEHGNCIFVTPRSIRRRDVLSWSKLYKIKTVSNYKNYSESADIDYKPDNKGINDWIDSQLNNLSENEESTDSELNNLSESEEPDNALQRDDDYYEFKSDDDDSDIGAANDTPDPAQPLNDPSKSDNSDDALSSLLQPTPIQNSPLEEEDTQTEIYFFEDEAPSTTSTWTWATVRDAVPL